MYVVQKQGMIGEYVSVLACQHGADAFKYCQDNKKNGRYRILQTKAGHGV